LNAKLLEIAQTNVAMYDAYFSEMEQTTADETYLQHHRRFIRLAPHTAAHLRKPRCRPLGEEASDTPEHVKYEQETTLAQARWLALSSNSKQIFARNSSEYVPVRRTGDRD